MATSSGWDPGLPPTAVDGRPTVPEWMGGVGIGQLQILSLQAIDEEKKLCPFVVGKSMHDLVGEIEGTSTEANGLKYVLRVRDAGQARKLIGMNKLFDGTAVKIEPHPILNKRRCVISCREIQEKSEEELMQWLAKDGVVGVRRITRMENGKPVNTPTVILTINGTAIPEHIKVGPLRVKTRIYIPDPMICFRCFKYGHSKFRCKSEPKCRNCSETHNLDGECQAAAFCLHCQGNHGPAHRSCPVYVMEKEVVRLRFTKGISQQEALKQVKSGGGSYAAVSQVQQRLVNAQATSAESEKLKEKDAIIKQLMETVAKLTSRIEELEKKSRTKKEKKRAKRSDARKTEESGSEAEMETDSSAKQSLARHHTTGGPMGGGNSSQVSGTLLKSNANKHKRHPTTEIVPPVLKKPMSDDTPAGSENPQIPSGSKNSQLTSANSHGIIDHLKHLMDSSRLDLPPPLPNNVQPHKSKK